MVEREEEYCQSSTVTLWAVWCHSFSMGLSDRSQWNACHQGKWAMEAEDLDCPFQCDNRICGNNCCVRSWTARFLMTEISVLFSTYFLPQHTYLLRKSNVLCLPLRMKSETKGETFRFNLYCSMIRPTILAWTFWDTVGCLSTYINQIYIKPYVHITVASLFCVLDSVSLFTWSLIPVRA